MTSYFLKILQNVDISAGLYFQLYDVLILNSPVAAAPRAARNTAHTGEATADVHMACSFYPPSSDKQVLQHTTELSLCYVTTLSRQNIPDEEKSPLQKKTEDFWQLCRRNNILQPTRWSHMAKRPCRDHRRQIFRLYVSTTCSKI